MKFSFITGFMKYRGPSETGWLMLFPFGLWVGFFHILFSADFKRFREILIAYFQGNS